MAQLIKVATVDEIPPGSGKTVRLGEREVRLVNVEGRFYATAAAPRHLGGPAGEGPPGEPAAPPCAGPGGRLDAELPGSPSRLRSDDERYQVHVARGDVLLLVEDSGQPARPAPRGEPAPR